MGEHLLDPGGVGEADEHRHVAAVHLFEQFADLAFGLLQARRLLVGGLHAGRVVDQEDGALADLLFTSTPRVQHGQQGKKDQEELQEQEQV